MGIFADDANSGDVLRPLRRLGRNRTRAGHGLKRPSVQLRINDGDREVATLLTGGKRLQDQGRFLQYETDTYPSGIAAAAASCPLPGRC